MLTSLVPRPSPFFVLRFAFSIIQKRATKKRGRPGLIHHVSDVRWTRGGHENDVREEGPNHKKQRTGSYVWVLYHSSGLKTLAWSKLLAFTGKKLTFEVYLLHIWMLAPPATSPHVHSRDGWDQAFPVFCALPLPCIILNANRRTKTVEAWERGYMLTFLTPQLVLRKLIVCSRSRSLVATTLIITGNVTMYWLI